MEDFTYFLASNKVIIIILHSLSMAIGLGAATITDVLFFRFLKDGRISKKEHDVMTTLSKVIWFALALAFITGFALYIPKAQILNTSSKFLLKVVVVSVLTINGLILHKYISPKLISISFTRANSNPFLEKIRKISFALGGISITSWYTAFLLGSVSSLPFSAQELIVSYGILILAVVAVSQIFAYTITYKK